MEDSYCVTKVNWDGAVVSLYAYMWVPTSTSCIGPCGSICGELLCMGKCMYDVVVVVVVKSICIDVYSRSTPML